MVLPGPNAVRGLRHGVRAQPGFVARSGEQADGLRAAEALRAGADRNPSGCACPAPASIVTRSAAAHPRGMSTGISVRRGRLRRVGLSGSSGSWGLRNRINQRECRPRAFGKPAASGLRARRPPAAPEMATRTSQASEKHVRQKELDHHERPTTDHTLPRIQESPAPRHRLTTANSLQQRKPSAQTIANDQSKTDRIVQSKFGTANPPKTPTLMSKDAISL